MLGTLATLALILPNFTVTAPGPAYSILQLEGIGFMSLVLWGVFVFVQTVKHRDYFLDAAGDADLAEAPHEVPGGGVALVSLALLLLSLVAVVLLAKVLSATRSTRHRRGGAAEGLRRRRDRGDRAACPKGSPR